MFLLSRENKIEKVFLLAFFIYKNTANLLKKNEIPAYRGLLNCAYNNPNKKK